VTEGCGHILASRLALTIPEAATALGISERHLRSMLPELPHCRIGGRVVLPVESLREWLRHQAQAEQQGAEAVAREIAESLARDR
jgi:excisionase family DNA binding protein